jgi:predicted regulator of Ras-like GTPase activity (Roadblock/LC7/MglB family)
MSVLKFKFAGLLRGLLRRFEDEETGGREAFRPVNAAASRVSASVPPPEVLQPAFKPVSVPPSVPAKPDEIQLPLQPILAALPMELRAKIMVANTTGMAILIPVEKALTQLATGSVKISFGELRQLAPGVFANSGGEHDAKPVALPLNQILAQLNPTLLGRRAAQKKHVEISDDISSPFDAHGQGLKISTEKLKAPPATPPPTTGPLPLPSSRFATPSSVASVPTLPVVSPPPTFTPRWKSPAGNGSSNGSNGSRQTAGFDVPRDPVAPKSNGTTPAPASIERPILASLAVLSESWPEALKMEIEQLDLANAKVALPVNLIEPALKRGRVIFAWRDLRSWIQNVAVAVSVHDGVELELPLKVLAPLFFTRQKNGSVPKKISVAEEIPNLFFGFPQPASAPPAPTPSAVAAVPLPDTNFFSRTNQPETTDSEFKRKGGTDFSSRVATPSEIVFRAMELPGVAGVVIALPDGLKVASQIPADLNGDTLAAFLPQIFARVNQCSRELRMGDMNNLSFTVGNVPWKIFRVNAVYFAAFGRVTEPLPGVQLASLAAELDRKKQ